jgi:transcriptional regulator with XRE-family HTH domain
MKLFNIAHFHRSRLRRLVEPTGALGSIMISGAQIRAARGLLGWTRHDLARRAVVSDATAYALENDRGSAANPSTLAAVQSTLETAGIEFLNGTAPGLRLHSKSGDDPTE